MSGGRNRWGMVLWAMLFVVFTVPNTAHAYSGDYSDITIANATMLAVLFMALYMFTRFFYFAKFNAEKLEMEVSDFEETPEALFRMIFCVYFDLLRNSGWRILRQRIFSFQLNMDSDAKYGTDTL